MMTLTRTMILLFALHALPVALPAQQPPPLSGTGLTKLQLELWNSPEFQRQFTESYLSETEIEPRVSEEERLKLQEILELIAGDQMDGAAQLIQETLAAQPETGSASAVFDFILANIYFQREELEQAAEHYQSAVSKFPKFRRAWKNLSLIYVRQAKYEEALPALRRVIELGGSDAITYGLLGFAYSNEENFLSAEAAYRMAILFDPETLDWKLGLARSFFKQERYAEAVALTGQLIEANPDRTDLWLLQANAYIGLGQALEAAEVYEIVDNLGGSTPESLNMLADIYVNEELYDVAAETYIRAMNLGGGQKPASAIRAVKILSARGAFDATRRLIGEVQNVFGAALDEAERKELLRVRARLAVAQGEAEQEAEVLREIVELDPLDGEALILLGQHEARDGDIEQAVFYFERAQGIEGFEADAKVRHAQLLVREGNYEKALPLLRSAQQANYRENVQEYLDQVERVARNR